MKNEDYFNNTRFDTLDLITNENFKKILEIGGGTFSTLKYLKNKCSAEAWGMDPYFNSSNELSDMNILQGYIDIESDQSKLPKNYFDLIIANDVIEHIIDTDLFFRTCNQLLIENGTLLISVPNIRQLRSFFNIFILGTFPNHESGLFDKTHLRWFCKKDIYNFARKNGFIVTKHKYKGRFVNKLFNLLLINDFFALQNIFVLKKI